MLVGEKQPQSSRLGDMLLDKGWINEVQLNQALTYQSMHHCKLGESFIALGLLDSRQLKKVLCKQRWIRSLVAGMVMVSSPICPVLADEENDTFKFVVQSGSHWHDNGGFDSQPLALGVKSAQQNFEAGISHKFSNHYGFQLGVTSDEPLNNRSSNESHLVPQITFFSTQSSEKPRQSQKLGPGRRADRYKNTIPAVYRLTLKGYSIYENSDKGSKYLEFDKVSDSPYKKYELMFSVTKRF